MPNKLTLNNDITVAQSLLRNLILQKTIEARATERRSPRESPPAEEPRRVEQPPQEDRFRVATGRRIDVFG